jgi:hypothetical protein
MSDDERLDLFDEYLYVFRMFANVPHVVGGRMAALALGVPVRPTRLDLSVADAHREAARRALCMLSPLRWSERWQEFRDYDADLTRQSSMRWRVAGHLEVRLELATALPRSVQVRVGERQVRVKPLVDLAASDPDIADLVRRVGL